MKVLMFGWEFPPVISGGLGTACYGLSKELAQKSIRINFVLPKIISEQRKYENDHIKLIGGEKFFYQEKRSEKTSSELNRYFEKEFLVSSPLTPYMNSSTYEQAIQKESMSESVKSTSEYFKQNYSIDFSGNYGENLISEVHRFSLIGKLLGKSEDFDIIHAHDWMTFLGGIAAKKESGKPLIVHIHATEIDRCGENGNSQIFEIEKYGMEFADKVIAVSNRTKEIIMRHYQIPATKIEVVHNGVDLEDVFDSSNNQTPFKQDRIVLYLGRITMQKGPDYFLEAANLVLKRMENIRFVMAGSGDMTRRLIERMAVLRIADRFHFTGFLGKSARELLFSMSDLYVMPSVSEPFGITPLEAMRYNIPVIISKQSGVAEILPNAIKVDFWDIQKLASAIVNVLERPQIHKQLSEQNWDLLRNLDWGKAADKVINVYHSCLKK